MTPIASDTLSFDITTRVLSGPRGHVGLDAGPALLVERLLATPGKLAPRSELVAALALPDTVGDEADTVLRSHLKVVRVLASALSGGAMHLHTRGQEAAGLIGPAKSPPLVGKRASERLF